MVCSEIIHVSCQRLVVPNIELTYIEGHTYKIGGHANILGLIKWKYTHATSLKANQQVLYQE